MLTGGRAQDASRGSEGRSRGNSSNQNRNSEHDDFQEFLWIVIFIWKKECDDFFALLLGRAWPVTGIAKWAQHPAS